MDERSLWALRFAALLLVIGLLCVLFGDGCGRAALDTRGPYVTEVGR